MIVVRFLMKSPQGFRAMPYYAVANGREIGVFDSWDKCQNRVNGYSGARYKKFNSEQEALAFIQDNNGGSSRANVRPVTELSTITTKTCKTATNIKKPPDNSSNEPNSSSSNKNFNVDDLDDPFEIDEAVSKQLDALENRLEGVKENVDKIYNKYGSKAVHKRTLPTEAHHLHKRNRSSGSQYDVVDEYIQVYTDGACSSNGQVGARAGYGVWWGDDHPLNESGRVERATNNSGEIRAAARACQLAKENGIEKLCINTDSKFLIDSVTKWMPGWKRNNWQLKSGGPVKNREDFEELERSARGISVKYSYVEAHKGVHGNEQADELARRGASS